MLGKLAIYGNLVANIFTKEKKKTQYTLKYTLKN